LLCDDDDDDDDAIVYLKERLKKTISLRASLNSSWHVQLSVVYRLSAHLTLRPLWRDRNWYIIIIIIIISSQYINQLTRRSDTLNSAHVLGARSIFSRGGQIRGLGTKIPQWDPAMGSRWGSEGESAISRRQVVKIMHE